MEQSVDDGARTNRPDSMDDGRTVYWRTLFGIQQVDPRFELRGAESPVDQEIIRNPDRNNGGRCLPQLVTRKGETIEQKY
jgi:hypothetical protein